MNLFSLSKVKCVTTFSGVLLAFIFSHSLYATEGYATRYWDGCKGHCSWSANSNDNPVKTCNVTNNINPFESEIASSCDGGDAYTCWDMSPKEVSDTLSYGYAAVPANGDVCGVCYQLTFTGTGKYNDIEPGSVALKEKGKTMIVMATNIGYDVSGGQFDLLIPGGGVGAFDAASKQWGVSNDALGEQYGGFLAECQGEYGYDDTDTLKSCVRTKCDTIFNQDGMENLKSGCHWYVDWFEMADNPNLEYEEVECPAALVTGAYEDVGDDVIVDDSDDADTDDAVVDDSDDVDADDSDDVDTDDAVVDDSDDADTDDAIADDSDDVNTDDAVADDSDDVDTDDVVVDDSNDVDTDDAVVDDSDDANTDDAIVDGSNDVDTDDAVVDGSDDVDTDDAVVDDSDDVDTGDTAVDEEDSTTTTSSKSGGLVGFHELLVLFMFVYIRKRKFFK